MWSVAEACRFADKCMLSVSATPRSCGVHFMHAVQHQLATGFNYNDRVPHVYIYKHRFAFSLKPPSEPWCWARIGCRDQRSPFQPAPFTIVGSPATACAFKRPRLRPQQSAARMRLGCRFADKRLLRPPDFMEYVASFGFAAQSDTSSPKPVEITTIATSV
jgi:hypothetical protein